MRYPRHVVAQLVEWMAGRASSRARCGGRSPNPGFTDRGSPQPSMPRTVAVARGRAADEQQFTDTTDHRHLVARIVAVELPEDQDI